MGSQTHPVAARGCRPNEHIMEDAVFASCTLDSTYMAPVNVVSGLRFWTGCFIAGEM